MTIARGKGLSSALSAVVCLACLACSTVVAFVGPISAAHGSATRVNRKELATTSSVSPAPGCFTPAVIDFSTRTRTVATVALTAGEAGEAMTMAAEGSKKTAIITGASSGED